MSYTISETPAHWFAVYTASRHEKHVSQLLQDRQVETFLPLYQSVHAWKNRTRVAVELPLFPGYVFVYARPTDRGRILSVPGVFAFVGSKREAWPLPDPEMQALRAGIHQCNLQPHPYLSVGERARIMAGPFSGLEGVLVRKTNGLRFVISLDQIAQSFSVEVDAREVQPVPSELGRVS
jgi:transcription antitermination factor NusG